MPNITPSSGAPASPARGVKRGLKVRESRGTRSSTPMNIKPSRMVSAPRKRITVSWWASSTVLIEPKSRP